MRGAGVFAKVIEYVNVNSRSARFIDRYIAELVRMAVIAIGLSFVFAATFACVYFLGVWSIAVLLFVAMPLIFAALYKRVL